MKKCYRDMGVHYTAAKNVYLQVSVVKMLMQC